VYTLNGGQKSEEWYIVPAQVQDDKVTGTIPSKATHYLFNFIDENNFLVSYPDMPDILSGGQRKGKIPYSQKAFSLN
jgi:hypothetical protein